MSKLRELTRELVGDNADEIHAELTAYLKQIRIGGVNMSNVVKPTIPAEVADIIEAMRKIPYCNNRDIISAYNRDPGRRELRSIPFDTLLAALVNGYDRELTKEDQRAESERALADEYTRHRRGNGRYDEFCEDHAFADGIEFALDMTGIKIEGVNG